MDEPEARNLASVLENPLQTPVKIEEERSVSPTLGLDSIRASIFAGLVGLAITLVCVVDLLPIRRSHRGSRFAHQMIMLVGALTMFNIVLTLPGIAGIILTIGLAVDANVLIYERLREEMAHGKSLKVALQHRLRESVQLHFRRERHDTDHSRDSFLESERPGQGFRDLADASAFWPRCSRRSSSGGIVSAGLSIRDRLKRISMLHLISSQEYQFPRQRFHCLHVFARAASSLARQPFTSAANEFRRRFSRRRSHHFECAEQDRYRAGARRAETNRILLMLHSGIHASRQELHHDPHAD